MKLKGRKRTKTERGSRQKHDVEEKNQEKPTPTYQGREKVQWQKIKNHSSYGFVCLFFLLRSVVNG